MTLTYYNDIGFHPATSMRPMCMRHGRWEWPADTRCVSSTCIVPGYTAGWSATASTTRVQHTDQSTKR